MPIQRDYIISLREAGGPRPDQYETLDQWFRNVGALVRQKVLTRNQVRALWQWFGDAFSSDTLQGFVANKPHDHAGDFEIIDRIYTRWISPKKELAKWDEFFHWQPATEAVRNRKEYFKSLLAELEEAEPGELFVLNVGSGPCRDLHEYQRDRPATRMRFECLDADRKAIDYAARLLKGCQVTFHHRNAFRFKADRKYHLIWSAGLFDYLSDRQFIFLFRSLWKMVAPGGMLVVGNFSEFNPSRDYMEFGEWFLHHRSEAQLIRLAETAGAPPRFITLDREPTRINLFLRVRKE